MSALATLLALPLLLATPASQSAPAKAGPDSVVLTFAPPDGMACTQKLHTVVKKDFGGAAPATEDVQELTAELRWKRTKNGWTMTSRARSVDVKRDGKPIRDPMLDAATGVTFVHDVAEDGSLTRIEGNAAMIAALQSKADSVTLKMLAPLLNAETLDRRDQAEWNGRYASFAGKVVAAGDLFEGEETFASPMGPIAFTSLTRIGAIEQAKERTRVTILFAYDVDEESARRTMDGALERVTRGVRDAFGEAAADSIAARVPQGTMTIRGEGERVIDARTMTILSERAVRVIQSPVQAPDGRTVTITRTETKTWEYDCDK